MRFKRVPVLIVLAIVAALVASPWSAEAARLITGRQIKNNSVTGADIKDGSLTARDFAAGQLPAGARGVKGDNGAKGDTGLAGRDATANETLHSWSVSSQGNASGSLSLESDDAVPALTRIEVVDFRIDADLTNCTMGMLSVSVGSTTLFTTSPGVATTMPAVAPLLIPAGPARRLKLQMSCVNMDPASGFAPAPIPAFTADFTFLTTPVTQAAAVPVG